jgi:iron complex transport system substrate-binding protein
MIDSPSRIAVWGLAAVLLCGLGWILFVAVSLEDREAVLPEFRREGGQIVIESSDGEILRFDRPPQRVLPTNASIVDLLDVLVDADRIVALPKQAATWSRISDDDPRYAKHARFSRYDAESVLALKPDLVIASAFNNPETHARLREWGVPVLRLEIRNGLDEVYGAMRLLGALLDADDRAEAEIAALEKRREALAARTAGFSGLRALVYSNLGTGGWSFGAKSTCDEVFRLAGLKNAAADGGRVGSVSMSFEELIVLDPDIILVSGAGEGEAASSASARVLEGEPLLASLRARRQGAILRLPSRLVSSSSQEILTAAEALADLVAAWMRERKGDSK